jgi:predicted N-acetyltransferase YhbS
MKTGFRVMTSQQFTLRELQPSDGPALNQLLTEFDGDLTTRFLVDPYDAIIHGTENRTRGVVVETAGRDGLVGTGTVRFSKVQFNSELLPLAFLDGLKVQKEFRGNGLGYQIASWRIQKAREEFGEQGVIGTGMLHDNHASHAVAAKWSREFAESAFEVRFVSMVTRPPKALAGVTVREIEPSEYDEFTHKQNRFFEQYNFYAPSSPGSIVHALSVSVDGKKPYRYFAAIDARGNLLAGAQTWARGLLKSDTINDPPRPLRILNSVLHLLPPDFTMRDVSVSGLWYEPGQMKVAQFFWEMLRWACRDQGSILTTGFDLRDPSMNVVTLKPWNQPRPRITFAIHGPTTMDRDRLLFVSGRV